MEAIYRAKSKDDFLAIYDRHPFPYKISVNDFDRLCLKVLVKDRMDRGLTAENLNLFVHFCLVDKDSFLHPTYEIALRKFALTDIVSRYYLGLLQTYGLLGVSRNLQKGHRLLVKASAKIEPACFVVGENYFLGRGVPVSHERASFYLEKAKSNPMALYYLGKIAKEKEEYEKAFAFFSEAYEKGNAPSCHELANCCLNGLGTDKDSEKAYRFAIKGAERKDSESYALAGNMCLHGIGRRKDYPLAEYYFRKDLNNINCLIGYGDLLCVFRPEQIGKALSYYLKSSHLGSKEGAKKYAFLLFQHGKGEDQLNALSILSSLSIQDRSLCYPIFEMYMEIGRIREAKNYLKLAKKHNDPKASELWDVSMEKEK